MRTRWTLPNILSGFRLLAAPVMILLAVGGHRDGFLALLAASFFTDAVDGTVARLTRQATRFGAMLDSWADVAAYAAIALSTWLLWPELVRQERVAIGVVVASFVLPALAGLVRFGRFTSYHTRLVKLAVVAVAVGLFLLLLDLATWPFRLAAGVAALAAVEEMAITVLLHEERSNVRGLRAVWQARGVGQRRTDRDP